MKTRVTELLGIEYPIIEGGLVDIGEARLAAAVSNAGGLGVIAAGGRTREQLVEQIRLAKSLTDKPFGINIPLSARQAVAMFIEVIIEEKVPVVATSAGNPELYTGRLREAGIKVLHVIPSVRHAKKAESVGVDAVVAEGFEAGGHNGLDEITTMALVPQVVDAVTIPVIAAGGIADARGFMAAFALGAEGVQIGTRFVATKESIAHDNYKHALVQADDTATTLIERGIGRLARVLKGPMPHRILEMEKAGASVEDLLPYMAGQVVHKAAVDGDLEAGYVYSGQIAGMLNEIVTVKEVIDSIMRGATVVRQRLNELDA